MIMATHILALQCVQLLRFIDFNFTRQINTLTTISQSSQCLIMLCTLLLVAPKLLVVTPMNSTVINISWSEIQCLNESGAVAHYIVQYQSLCDGAVQNVTTGGTVQTVSGLTPNCVYTFRVAAVGAGEKIGPFSNPVNVSLPGECRRYS